MKNHPLVVAILIGYAFIYSDVVIAEGVKTPSRITNSSQSPIQDNQTGDNYFAGRDIIVNKFFVAKNNSLQAKQEALLVAQNQTKLQVTNLRWTSWFGDSEPFLTFELSNTSNLPAGNIQISILDNKTGATLEGLKPYKLSKSYILKILGTSAAVLKSNSKIELPVASLTDIETIIASDCVTGAGLDFLPPRAIDIDANSVAGISQGKETGIYVNVRYTDIFRQKVSFNRLVIIDSSNRKSDYLVKRDSNKTTRLICVGDADWNTKTHIGSAP